MRYQHTQQPLGVTWLQSGTKIRLSKLVIILLSHKHHSASALYYVQLANVISAVLYVGYVINCYNFYRTTAYMQSAQYAIAASPVRLSVRPSHGWISQKRWKVGLRDFHGKLALSIQFLWDNFHPEILLSLSREVNQGWRGENKLFSSFMHQYFEKVKRYVHVTINDK